MLGAGGAPVFALFAGAVSTGAAVVFCVASVLAAPCAGDAAGDAAGEGDDGGGVSSAVEFCTAERCPVIAGNESAMATSMKSAAAPIVSFARIVCVPRGPKAVLEMLLEKSAPASALPGCKRMETMSTMLESMNRMYKRVVN